MPEQTTPVRLPWVRVIDGVLTLCWYWDGPEQHQRPLTFRERVAWKLVARTPSP